jgi:hypothetical protein
VLLPREIRALTAGDVEQASRQAGCRGTFGTSNRMSFIERGGFVLS